VIVEAHGLSLDVPDGWEARIYRRPHGDPTLHAANFPLPVDDGDFGAGAVLTMPAGGEFVCLTEYRPGQGLVPGRGLFAGEPVSLPLKYSHFHPRALHVARSGCAGLQHFFTSAGRPFCLYAVIRPARGQPRAAGSSLGLNRVLSTVSIAAAHGGAPSGRAAVRP
jgi:hypothetical protein